MAGRRFTQAFKAAAERDRKAIEEAARPHGCASCGGVFGGSAAYQVHRDDLGRGYPECLSPMGQFRGQLVEVDGVWCTPGSDAARR